MKKRIIRLALICLTIMTVIPLILFATSASEAAPTASAGDLPGDINADGKVNLKDVIILYRHIAGENVKTDIHALDTNGDDEVDIDDATLLFRSIAGWRGITLNRDSHTEGEWITDKEATKTEDGSKHQVCADCGATIKTEVVYAIGSSGLQYRLNSDGETYSVIGLGTCTDTDLYIPSIYNGKPVTCIGESAFYESLDLTSVVISEGIKLIERSAFGYCVNLRNLTLPNSLSNIGDSAFLECPFLEYNKYDNANYLGNSNNPYLALVSAIDYSITTCSINNNTKIIVYNAFYNRKKLTSIVIPEGVEAIGKDAFRYCEAMTDITIPNSLRSLGESVFTGCNKLVYNNYDNACYIGNSTNPYVILVQANNYAGLIETCVVNGNTKFLNTNCFSAETKLKSITLPDGLISIGSYSFYRCGTLGAVTIPDSVTYIGKYAFEDCGSLKSIAIPKGVTFIGDGAFCGCSQMIGVLISDSVTSIANKTFMWCNKLSSVIIPDSVEIIGESAFSGCSSLQSIIIPNSVLSIGSSAFSGCSSLKSVIIPKSVTSLGSSIFANCDNLANIVVDSGNSCYFSEGNCLIETASKTLIAGCHNSLIPDNGSVTSIGRYAFNDCNNLTSITIPSSVTNIDPFAFYDCHNLKSITIPSGVTSIGASAFRDCSGLEYFSFNGTKAQWRLITKGVDWKLYAPFTVVVCTDGTVGA